MDKKTSFKNQLAKLVDLKSLVTIAIVTALVISFLKSGQTIDAGQFMTVVAMVLTYYFTRKKETE